MAYEFELNSRLKGMENEVAEKMERVREDRRKKWRTKGTPRVEMHCTIMNKPSHKKVIKNQENKHTETLNFRNSHKTCE